MKKQSIKLMNLILSLCIVLCMCLTACGDDNSADNYEHFIMTVNRSDYKLVKHEHKFLADTTEGRVEELISALIAFKDKEENSPIMNEESFMNWVYEDDVVKLYFNSEYYDISLTNEAIYRAAVVNTLCQLDEVEYVEYFVDDTMLTIDGRVIGPMNNEFFVSGLSFAEATNKVTLYFPDKSMKGLVKVEREVDVNPSLTDEEAIIKQLIMGPKDGEAGVRSIPEGTKLKTIVTKDRECYVTFTSEFLNYLNNVPDYITVYSIVNTLCNMSEINSVSIRVEDEDIEFYNSYNISGLLDYNHDILLDNEE